MSAVLTKKWVCDGQGNWFEVPVILTRSGDGWIETFPAPSDRASRKEAA